MTSKTRNLTSIQKTLSPREKEACYQEDFEKQGLTFKMILWATFTSVRGAKRSRIYRQNWERHDIVREIMYQQGYVKRK